MAYYPLISLALLLAQDSSPQPLAAMLKRVEDRYNSTKTLRSEFEQTMAISQGRRITERGVLYLRKPGQMRWEYSQPASKLFLSDGKQMHYVSPSARRVEVSAVKESEDLRAPLAFLLGKLDFKKDFQRFEHSQMGAQWKIRAFPKSQKSIYDYVEFLAEADGRLSVVIVAGKDGSTMSYAFLNEQRNNPLAADLFVFHTPPGYDVVNLRAEP